MILGIKPTLLGIIIAVLFGLLPDFDVFAIIPGVLRGDKSKIDGTTFKHHEYPTHFPLLYSPLIAIVIIFPNIYTYTMITALYLHLFLDSFYTSDGIKWLFPFKNKFYNLQSDKTIGKHGILWENEYKKTPMYKLEFLVLGGAGFVVWLNHIFYYPTPIDHLVILGVLIICFCFGLVLVERARSKYIEKKTAEIKNLSV